MPKFIRLSSLLIDLEAELRQLSLWQSEAPSIEALASSEPFCIDTMNFSQWLQFVFLDRMARLIERRQTLPDSCSIAPMWEEYVKGLELNTGKIMTILKDIDRLLSG